MATKTWIGGSGSWETASNWDFGLPVAGDDVVLPSGSSYVVTVAIAAPVLNSLSVGNYSGGSSVKLQLNSGATVHTTGAINIGLSSVIGGQGVLQADGGFGIVYNGGSGNASILAGTATTGGTLEVTGNIDFNIALGFANTSYATTLKLEGTQTNLSTITIGSDTQTLELGAGADTTFNSQINVAGGTIQLDGATLRANNGVSLTFNATLTGAGELRGNISGSGSVIAAAGGTLTLSQAVGNDGAHITKLVLGSGSSLLLTSTYGIGADGSSPTVNFQGVATSEIFQAVNESIYTIHIGTISGFGAGDYIKLGSFGAGDKLTYDASAHTITLTDAFGSNPRVFTFDASTDVSAIFAASTDGSGNVHQAFVNGVTADILTICFLGGTSIRTPDGDSAVETLKRGDLVVTAQGETRAVVWIGRQTIASRFADPLRNWPIRVTAGALAENIPARDLLVSPDHALLVGDVLVHAGALVNGATVLRERVVPESFVYYHVELEDHALILAENVPAETFIDNADRRNFDNWEEHEALYPQGRAVPELPLPRAKSRRQVPDAIRAALDERAARMAGSAAA